MTPELKTTSEYRAILRTHIDQSVPLEWMEVLDDADTAAALAEQVAQLQAENARLCADQQFAVDILTGGYSAFTLREAVLLIDGKIKTYCKSMEDLQAENAALMEYGSHKWNCALHTYGVECSCGWREIVAAL